MRKQFLLVAIFAALIFLPVTLFAQQAPAVEWEKVYGGIYLDDLFSVEQTSDGGFILGGYSESDISSDKTQNSKGQEDFWIIKVDSHGTKVWDKTYGGNNGDYLYVIRQTKDGGYIAGGWSSSDLSGDKTQPSEGGSYQMWVIKLDANGNKIWDRSFGGNRFEALNSLVETADGGYLLGGSSGTPAFGDKSQPSKGKNDFWVIKLDGLGNKLWDKVYGGSGADDLLYLIQSSDGGFILGGNSYSDISGDKSQASRGEKDIWIVKIDGSGNLIWEKTFGGRLDEHLTSVHETPEGGFILGCSSRSPASGDKTEGNRGNLDFWVIKTDAVGNKIWDRTFGGGESESLLSLDITSDGNYILGGGSASGINIDRSASAMGFYDYWVIKIDPDGNKIWDKTLGGNDGETINSLQQTTDGGYILAGGSYSDISGNKTIASKGNRDFWLIKLAPDILTEKDLEIKIYPNPSQGSFSLQLAGVETQEAELQIFNYSGRLVHEETLFAKNKRIVKKMNLHYRPGIYLLQVKYGNQKHLRKLVIE